MKRLDILREAREEFEDAADYYEREREGLSGEFRLSAIPVESCTT